MTVRELINNLLDEPMDEEVKVRIKCNIVENVRDDGGIDRLVGYLFDIDDVDGTYINFTDWRAEKAESRKRG